MNYRLLRNLIRKNRLRSPGKRWVSSKPYILGIETSCDDTGVAIVDGTGKICGESLKSQQSYSTRFGGVIPIIAARQHKLNLPLAYDEALKASGLLLTDIDAIAVTVQPGIVISLKEGIDFALKLCKSTGIPLITVHHMQAHALTARWTNSVKFPYMCLLISGGHSLITWVKSVNEFIVIGQNLDNAPGEVLDKVARRLKLVNLKPEYAALSGGALIEMVAANGDPFAFDLPDPSTSVCDCNYSFSGIITDSYRQIERLEQEHGILGGSVLPNYRDFAASVQHSVFRHLAGKLIRAFEYVKLKEWVTEDAGYPKTLVTSGGVASNGYIRKGLEYLVAHYGCSAVFPPAKYCTDNGVMIAWNGLDKFNVNIDVIRDLPDSIIVNARSPIGEDANADVISKRLKRKYHPIWRSIDLKKNFYLHQASTEVDSNLEDPVASARC